MVRKREDYERDFAKAKNAPPKKIDCEFVREITCPWCGHKANNSWQLHLWDGDEDEIECGECDRNFTVTCSVTIDYTSRKIETPTRGEMP